MNFSIPADFNTQTIKDICHLHKQYKHRVTEVYGQLTSCDMIFSAREAPSLPTADEKQLQTYIEICHANGILFNYTLNASCLGNLEFRHDGIKMLKEFIQQLASYGIDSFTITLPSLMELVSSMDINIPIKASAICEVTTPNKAMFYKSLGIHRLVVEPDITRDFQKLNDICSTFGPGVEIIVNNMCMKNCPYKKFHYNHDSHYGRGELQSIKNYYFHNCALRRAENVENYLKINWIRPEDLHFYQKAGISCFKIQGRQNLKSNNLLRALECYFKESYQGDVLQLFMLFSNYNSFALPLNNQKLDGYVRHFYENHNFCTDNCEKCGFCEAFSKKNMLYSDQATLNKKATMFYKTMQRNIWNK